MVIEHDRQAILCTTSWSDLLWTWLEQTSSPPQVASGRCAVSWARPQSRSSTLHLFATCCGPGSRGQESHLESFQADLQCVRQDLKATAPHSIHILVASVAAVLVIPIQGLLPHVGSQGRFQAVDPVGQLQRQGHTALKDLGSMPTDLAQGLIA